MIKRVYIDTSVVGGQFDKEFSADTIPFFDAVVIKGEFNIIVSDLLDVELLRAPDRIRNFLQEIPETFIERIRLSEEAANLADKYIEAKVVGRTSRADCQHIAMATIAHADVLVSWNFKHIVNLDRIRGYNGINYQFGYSMIEIRTPKEIISYENIIIEPIQDIVLSLRKVRDGISDEIKDMTFEEERAFLDKLLKEGKASKPFNKEIKGE